MAIEIVVPVYNAASALEECLRSLALHCEPEQSIVIIDDASTDARVARIISQFADRPSRRWIAERSNRGFVATANLGFSITSGDVLLLNSDTVVTAGWLDRLQACLNSDEAIGTATPFSNNAEICSIPQFVANNPAPPDPDAVARTMARLANPTYPELPTAVGFCMLIRREVIDQIGGFDVQTFGKGYGEENDFSMRARAAGFRNVLCDDAYVVHRGAQSFADTQLRPGPETMSRLLSKHPDYAREVAEFIAADPIARRREAIIARCQSAGVRL